VHFPRNEREDPPGRMHALLKPAEFPMVYSARTGITSVCPEKKYGDKNPKADHLVSGKKLLNPVWLIYREEFSMKPGIFLAIVLLSGVIICGCLSPAPAMTSVRVAYQPTTANGPLYIAQEEGYFAQQGIDVEFVRTQSPAAALPLLVHGDIAVSGGPLKIGLINAMAKGEHVRIVADKGRVAAGACPAYALMVRRDLFDNGIVTNVSGLRGRKIAVRDSDYDLFNALAPGNLSRDDVEAVDMDFASIIPAFKNGAIDAGLVTEPYITQARNNGAAVILVPAQDFIPDWPLPLYYGPAILDKDPDLGRRFMVAYLQGVKQYNEGKTERNLGIMGNYTQLDRELLNQSCWYPIAADGNLPRQSVRQYVDWMYANKKISQNLNDDQLLDPSYVTYANGILRNATKSGQT
jgi:NitT/TauT family transport system substrate-binding protein